MLDLTLGIDNATPSRGQIIERRSGKLHLARMIEENNSLEMNYDIYVHFLKIIASYQRIDIQ